MPQKVAWFKMKIDENRHNLFYYFLFLRLTPIVPNWFLNASSGVVGVPYWVFLSASLVGLLPYTFILLNMGFTLDKITHVGIDPMNMATLFGLAILSLIPAYLTKKEERIDEITDDIVYAEHDKEIECTKKTT